MLPVYSRLCYLVQQAMLPFTAGYSGGARGENKATSWPILQAETCQILKSNYFSLFPYPKLNVSDAHNPVVSYNQDILSLNSLVYFRKSFPHAAQVFPPISFHNLDMLLKMWSHTSKLYVFYIWFLKLDWFLKNYHTQHNYMLLFHWFIKLNLNLEQFIKCFPHTAEAYASFSYVFLIWSSL